MKNHFVPRLRIAALSAAAAIAPLHAQTPVPAGTESAHFKAAAQHLEIGGGFFGYMDIDGDFAGIAPIADRLLALARQQPGGENIPEGIKTGKLLEASGLGSLKALGFMLVVSGGHCNLYDCRSATECELLGSTIDDAVGEAFDKVASMLGLPYPGGPSIQKAAAAGNRRAYAFPRSFEKDPRRLEFSFSGLKTAVLYELAGKPPAPYDPAQLAPGRVADIAASFQEAAVDVLVAKARQALDQCGYRTLLVGGGVAANARLRERLQEAAERQRWRLIIAPPQLCTDNAAMSAIAWELLASGRTAGLEVDVVSGLVRRPRTV